jgi:hypothetical protein
MRFRTITAKFDSVCGSCGCEVQKGTRVKWARGKGVHHLNCLATGNSRADAEYWQGRRDVDNWRFNKMVYGEAAAEVMEIEREIFHPEY